MLLCPGPKLCCTGATMRSTAWRMLSHGQDALTPYSVAHADGDPPSRVVMPRVSRR